MNKPSAESFISSDSPEPDIPGTTHNRTLARIHLADYRSVFTIVHEQLAIRANARKMIT